MSLGIGLLTIGLATAAIWVASDWLEEASALLALHYDLPPVVQGGIIAAIGSSFPELASVVIAGLYGSFDLGVGAVVGSAMFNVLVIPALAVLLSPGDLSSTRTLVHKETLFYVLSILVLFLTFALALIYVPGSGGDVGTVTRTLAVFPLAVYGLYLFAQWQDTTDYAGPLDARSVNVRRQWLFLLAGLVVILVAVERLVAVVLDLGATFGTSEFLWGVTVVAIATSLPDTLVSVKAAHKDRDVASVSNVLGSNTFDLLVVIPVGVLLVGAVTVDFAIAAPLLACLFGATVLFFVTLRTDLALTNGEAVVLLGSYLLFLAWMVLETVGRLGLLG